MLDFYPSGKILELYLNFTSDRVIFEYSGNSKKKENDKEAQ